MRASTDTSTFQSILDKSLSYSEYQQFVADLAKAGKSSGGHEEPVYTRGTWKNDQLMTTVPVATELLEESKAAMSRARPMTWIVLTESWCSDAHNVIPVLQAMAMEAKDVDIRLVLRDENLDFMDQYLTNGGRSIPKLIAIDKTTQQELFTWGPRPKTLQDIAVALKKSKEPFAKVAREIQSWYDADKGKSIQQEIISSLNKTNA